MFPSGTKAWQTMSTTKGLNWESTHRQPAQIPYEQHMEEKPTYPLWRLTSVVCEIWFCIFWVFDQFPKWYRINRETYNNTKSIGYLQGLKGMVSLHSLKICSTTFAHEAFFLYVMSFQCNVM